jgi:hypothetical protein
MLYPLTLYSTMFYIISAKRKLKLCYYTCITQPVVSTVCANSFLVSLNSRQYMRGLLQTSTMQGPIELCDVQVRTCSIMQFGEDKSMASRRHEGRNILVSSLYFSIIIHTELPSRGVIWMLLGTRPSPIIQSNSEADPSVVTRCWPLVWGVGGLISNSRNSRVSRSTPRPQGAPS